MILDGRFVFLFFLVLGFQLCEGLGSEERLVRLF